jgi:hypothetical protein
LAKLKLAALPSFQELATVHLLKMLASLPLLLHLLVLVPALQVVLLPQALLQLQIKATTQSELPPVASQTQGQ